MEDLRLRYEAPNESNRWDFPLFKVSLQQQGNDGSATVADISDKMAASSIDPSQQAEALPTQQTPPNVVTASFKSSALSKFSHS